MRKWRFSVPEIWSEAPDTPVRKRKKEKSSNGLKTQLLDIESKILTQQSPE
jgi:hypothetical protein